MQTPDEPPIVSKTIDDIATPGVSVEVEPDEAERLGAFEEDALTDSDAVEANRDIES